MRYTRLLALLLAVGMALFGGGIAHAQEQTPTPTASTKKLTKADAETWLAELIPELLETSQVPGAVVTIVKDGEILTTQGYGDAVVGDGATPSVPVTEDTLFRVGSISKIPTAIAVMQLVDQGKLNLDEDINTYVDVDIDRKFDDPITVRNLLDHTAGFEERGHGVITFTDQSYPLEEEILTDPPKQVFKPGTTPAYSNYGIALAGYIVQEVSGIPFEEYIKQEIFEPAGMDSSTYVQPLPKELTGRMAAGYLEPGADASGFETVMSPAGSMTSSGKDFGRFMIAQLNGTLLPDDLMAEMWKPHHTKELGGLTKGDRMGLGYWLTLHNDQQVVGHGGDTSLFHSLYELYPEHNTGIFVSYNGNGTGVSAATVWSDFMKQFADRYFPATSKNGAQLEGTMQRAEQIAGTYSSSRSIHSNFMKLAYLLPVSSIKVTANSDNTINLEAGGMMNLHMEEVEPWVWREVSGDTRLAADPSGDQLRLSMGPMTLFPASFVHNYAVYIAIAALALLLVVVIAWPIGAVSNRRRLQRGDTAIPLSTIARSARAGALAAVLATAGWYFIAISFTTFSELPLRALQILQYLGLLAIIPAALALYQSIRSRANWATKLNACLLLVGLIGIAWWAVMANLYVPDLSY